MRRPESGAQSAFEKVFFISEIAGDHSQGRARFHLPSNGGLFIPAFW
jgi:hypothetical protein